VTPAKKALSRISSSFFFFAYQDTYQLHFDKAYDLLPATTRRAQTLSSDPIFARSLALPQAVQSARQRSLVGDEDADPSDESNPPSPAPEQGAGTIQQTASEGSLRLSEPTSPGLQRLPPPRPGNTMS